MSIDTPGADDARADATQLNQELRQAHATAQLLANIGKELASSLQLEEMLDRLVHVVVPAFADWAVVDLVERDFSQQVTVAHVDPQKVELAREAQRRYRPIRSPDSAMRRVLDSGEPRFVADIPPDYAETFSDDPAFARLLRRLNPRSSVTVPLSARQGAIGVISFLQSDSGRRFERSDVELAQEIGRRAALAIENAKLHRDTQVAEQRQRFLAEASRLLDSTLHYETTLSRLAELTVPALADWCAVHMLERDRLGGPIAIAHSDPSKIQLAQELQRRWPAELSAATGVSNVMRTGEPELVPDISDALLAARARGDEHLRRLRALGPWTSGLTVPLKARGRTLGALTLITAESRRRYGQDDVEFAMEVASRAALAIDNSRLYAAARRTQREAERLQLVTQQLGSKLAVEDILQEIANTAAELLNAPVAGVFLLDEEGQSFELAAGYGFDMSGDAIMRLPRDRSLAGEILSTGEPVLVQDVRLAPVTSLPRLVAGEAVGSLVVAPFESHQGPRGVVEVYSRSPGAFSPHDAQLLSTMAAAAASALANASSYAAEQRARREAQRLQALTEKLGRSIAPEEVLDQIAATATELLESPVAGVFLLDSSGEYVELAASRGLELHSNIHLPRAHSLAGHVMSSGKAVTVPDARIAPLTALPKLLSHEVVGALVAAPILGASGPLGVVEVYSTRIGAFDSHDADLLAALAGAAAAVLEHARLYRQRESDLARLQTILDQLPVAVLVADAPSGQVAMRNRRARELYGSTLPEQMQAAVEAHGRATIAEVRHESRPLPPLLRAAVRGEIVTGERFQIARTDGGRSFLSVNAAPIRDVDGKIVAAVGVYEDITDEEELRQQKEQFLAAAAHDLKTPITSIRGLSQLLNRQLSRIELPQPERIRATLQGIEGGTRKMTALIDELVDISRLETVGNLSLSRREVDLVELAQTVVEEHRAAAPHHAITVQTDAGHVKGYWDETRLERTISNLVGNAIKYSPDGGEVRVRIAQEIIDGIRFAVLSVSDQGIGIPANEQDRIFDRFHRGSNVPDGLSGSGVGLSYVREIIVQHGGDISVQGKPGSGTVFTIRLPQEST